MQVNATPFCCTTSAVFFSERTVLFSHGILVETKFQPNKPDNAHQERRAALPLGPPYAGVQSVIHVSVLDYKDFFTGCMPRPTANRWWKSDDEICDGHQAWSTTFYLVLFIIHRSWWTDAMHRHFSLLHDLTCSCDRLN